MAVWAGIKRAAALPWAWPRRRKSDGPVWGPVGGAAPWGWPWYGTGGDDLSLADARWLSATSRCISLLSDCLSSPPLYLTRATAGGGRQLVSSSDAARALAGLSFHSRECLATSMLADGNAYARLVRNDRGGVADLAPIAPWRVSLGIDDDNGAIWYRIAEDGVLQEPAEILPSSDILHIRCRPISSSHFLLGVSPLAQAARSLETVLRINIGARTYFKNLSLPSFLLSTDLVMSPDQVTQLRERWDEATKGDGLGGVPILTAGLKGTAIPRQSALESQLNEMSKLSVAEIGRAYGVPSSMLNETSSLNYATASEQSRAFAASTLSPLATRIADALSHALLSRDERLAGFAAYIDLSDLVLGQGKERSDYTSQLVNGGIISTNEARDMLGWAAVADGSTLRIPVNTSPLPVWSEGGPQPVALAAGKHLSPSLESQFRSSRTIRDLRRAL